MSSTSTAGNGVQLWPMADALRGSKDARGRECEYFLSQFTSAEGKKRGERRWFGVLRSEIRADSSARRPAPTRVTAVAFTEG